jgi:hypothetical protein
MPYFIRQAANAVLVEATQWFPGQDLPGVSSESAGHPGGGGLLPVPPHAYLHTNKGTLTVFGGDWVITEPDGRMHVFSNSLFQQTYSVFEQERPTGEELRTDTASA